MAQGLNAKEPLCQFLFPITAWNYIDPFPYLRMQLIFTNLDMYVPGTVNYQKLRPP